MGLRGIRALIVLNVAGFLASAAVVYVRVTRAATLEQPQVPVEPLVSGVRSEAPGTLPIVSSHTGVETSVPVIEEDAPLLREVDFTYVSKTARKVSLMGDFNDWVPQPMEKDGYTWKATVRMPEGTYLYNFLVDGKTTTDPSNKRSAQTSSQGFKSSVLVVE